MRQEVVRAQRRQLNVVDLQVGGQERLQRLVDLISLHGKQTHFGFHQKTVNLTRTTHHLVVPDHVIQGERDLLSSFEADDLRQPFHVDGRRLKESRQTVLAGNRDRHPVAADLIASQKLCQRLADQLLGIRIGLAQNLRVFDVVERRRHQHAVLRVVLTAHGLERTVTDIDAPNTCLRSH